MIVRDVTRVHERQQGLEAFARQILAAREEEAGRIARDLHDGPIQSLIVVRRKLDALGQLPARRSKAGTADVETLVDHVAEELRQTSRSLRPRILDHLGLVPALTSEQEAFALRTGIAVRFVTNGNTAQAGCTRGAHAAPRRAGSAAQR